MKWTGYLRGYLLKIKVSADTIVTLKVSNQENILTDIIWRLCGKDINSSHALGTYPKGKCGFKI